MPGLLGIGDEDFEQAMEEEPEAFEEISEAYCLPDIYADLADPDADADPCDPLDEALERDFLGALDEEKEDGATSSPPGPDGHTPADVPATSSDVDFGPPDAMAGVEFDSRMYSGYVTRDGSLLGRITCLPRGNASVYCRLHSHGVIMRMGVTDAQCARWLAEAPPAPPPGAAKEDKDRLKKAHMDMPRPLPGGE